MVLVYKVCIYEVTRDFSELLGFWYFYDLDKARVFCKKFHRRNTSICFEIQEVKNENK